MFRSGHSLGARFDRVLIFERGEQGRKMKYYEISNGYLWFGAVSALDLVLIEGAKAHHLVPASYYHGGEP
jgi:hypothetical protein